MVDPQRPGRYLLGVECDGRTYHSASWARDRDRLREQVLEGLGWSLHRVWSTDWFRNPDRELRKIAESLERARVSGGGVNGDASRHRAEASTGSDDEEGGEPFRREAPEHRDLHLGAEPYRCADLSALRGELSWRDLQTCSASWIAPWVVAVVEVESPVHEGEVVRRIVEAAGYQRAGSRLRRAVRRGIAHATLRSQIEGRGQFLWASDGTPVTVRDRGALPPSARKMDLVAPEEIEAAVLKVVDAAVGIAAEEACVEVARLFGFARTTTAMREPISGAISRLTERGAVETTGGHLRMGSM